MVGSSISRPVVGVIALAAFVGAALFLIGDDAEASHVLGSSLSVSYYHDPALAPEPVQGVIEMLAPRTYNVTAEHHIVYRDGYLGHVLRNQCIQGGGAHKINWGDGTWDAVDLKVVYFTDDVVVVRAMAAGCSEKPSHRYTAQHDANGDDWVASWTDCCRIGLVHNQGASHQVTASVQLTGTDATPAMFNYSIQPTARCERNTLCHFGSLVRDPDGQTVNVRLATSCEMDPACASVQPGPPHSTYLPAVAPRGYVSWDTANAQAGIYSISLVAETASGWSMVDYLVEVYALPPPALVADFEWAAPVYVGVPATFTSTSTIESGNITNYFWYAYGVEYPSSYYGAAYDAVEYTFRHAGTYYVRLHAYGNEGQFSYKTQYVQVTHAPPSADFNATGQGMTWVFTDTSTNLDGNITSWYWDFGDGTNSTAPSPTHKYKQGTYTVTLTATNARGVSDSKSKVLDTHCKGCTI